jgi:hypothetical protein
MKSYPCCGSNLGDDFGRLESTGGGGSIQPSGPSASRLPNLNGKSLSEAEETLRSEGFEFVNETAGGYRKYRAADGSEVHIRPDGEVVRLGPKIDPGPNQKNYAPRYGPDGQRLAPDQDHSTGEMVSR